MNNSKKKKLSKFHQELPSTTDCFSQYISKNEYLRHRLKKGKTKPETEISINPRASFINELQNRIDDMNNNNNMID